MPAQVCGTHGRNHSLRAQHGTLWKHAQQSKNYASGRQTSTHAWEVAAGLAHGPYRHSVHRQATCCAQNGVVEEDGEVLGLGLGLCCVAHGCVCTQAPCVSVRDAWLMQ
jgi:hypothetical protein